MSEYRVIARDKKHMDEIMSLVHLEHATYEGEFIKSIKVEPPTSEFDVVIIETYDA
jgi:hypothetical protein